MDADTIVKLAKITERLIAVRDAIKPIQRRVVWLKKKIALQPDNFYLRAEYDALSLCWSLLREERKRLKLFESYYNNQGDTDDNRTTEGSAEDEGNQASGSAPTKH